MFNTLIAQKPEDLIPNNIVHKKKSIPLYIVQII